MRLVPDRARKGMNEAARHAPTEMRRVVASIISRAHSEITSRSPVGATGLLRGGYGTELGPPGDRIVGRVVNPTLYHDYAETGRRPGRMPPPHSLENWVGTKLGVPPEDREEVAYLVARAIGKRGTKGAHMVEEGWAATRGKIAPELHQAGLRIVRRMQ